MNRSVSLAVRMLRYRAALTIWMFMLLAVAYHGGLGHLGPSLVWATVALGASYVAATTVNDIADRDIDRINHPRDRGRPLVDGTATPRDLWKVHAVVAIVAVAVAVPVGGPAAAVVGASVGIGWAYSLDPVRLAYRTYLAPLVLAAAYVVIPYALGLSLVRSTPGRGDIIFCAGLFSLFVARINLKDFRDREGDAAFGKPTLLLRFGKRATCAVSLGALLAGNALLLVALRPALALALVLEVFVVATLAMLRRLLLASDRRTEQVAIGVGAKMGNGLLITILGILALAEQGATLGDRLVFSLVLLAVYATAFVALARHPEQVVIGYKG